MRALILLIISPFLWIIGMIMGVHRREKWETVPLQKKGWPVESWDYKRIAGQNWVWKYYGNASEGVVPWFKGRQWGFWEWWWRNRVHNLNWHWDGYAWWIEGDPYGAWFIEHLERVFWRSGPKFIFSWVKPIKKPWPYWRYFIWFKLPLNFYFWYGWKPKRGQFAVSLKVRSVTLRLA